jgi:hypothetical protein
LFVGLGAPARYQRSSNLCLRGIEADKAREQHPWNVRECFIS